jgi:hypothetical protein
MQYHASRRFSAWHSAFAGRQKHSSAAVKDFSPRENAFSSRKSHLSAEEIHLPVEKNELSPKENHFSPEKNHFSAEVNHLSPEKIHFPAEKNRFSPPKNHLPAEKNRFQPVGTPLKHAKIGKNSAFLPPNGLRRSLSGQKQTIGATAQLGGDGVEGTAQHHGKGRARSKMVERGITAKRASPLVRLPMPLSFSR